MFTTERWVKSENSEQNQSTFKSEKEKVGKEVNFIGCHIIFIYLPFNSVSRNTVWGFPLCRRQKALSIRKAGSWPCPLTFSPASARGALIFSEASLHAKISFQRNPTSGAGGLPTPTLHPAPLRGCMQVQSSPTIPGPSETPYFSCTFDGSFPRYSKRLSQSCSRVSAFYSGLTFD